jgi:hypothetical protein
VSSQQDAILATVNEMIANQSEPKVALSLDEFKKMVVVGHDVTPSTASTNELVTRSQLCDVMSYVCETCSRPFKSPKWLQNHIEREHLELPSLGEEPAERIIQSVETIEERLDSRDEAGSAGVSSVSSSLEEWFYANYSKTCSKEDEIATKVRESSNEDRLKLKDVYTNLKESDFYLNLTKMERRKLSYNALLEYVERSPLLRMFYRERERVYSGGVNTTFNNFLTKHKAKPLYG